MRCARVSLTVSQDGVVLNAGIGLFAHVLLVVRHFGLNPAVEIAADGARVNVMVIGMKVAALVATRGMSVNHVVRSLAVKG